MSQYLIDLDELTLSCKDAEARKYIAEAVTCYKAGAFRACIVTTWIAVIYDFVYKLRELERTGDKNALVKLEQFEKSRRDNDLNQALQFEKNILGWARDEFEFLSPLQYTDLSRLLEDRNRCAHPSMISAEEIYEPPAELARYHLRNAITHLLQHAPVQGKAALDRLQNDTLSQYFPTETAGAVRYFSHGPLGNPKPALVRNFVISLLKTLLREDQEDAQWLRFTAALNAVRQMQRAETEKTLADHLSGLVLGLADDQLFGVVQLLEAAPDSWQFLGEDARSRVENYVLNVTEEEADIVLNLALDMPQLYEYAVRRLDTTESQTLGILVTANQRPEFVNRALDLYAQSSSFMNANQLGEEVIIPLMPFFTRTQLNQIIQAAIRPQERRYPNQIYHSTTFQRNVLPEMKRVHNIDDQEFQALVRPLQQIHPNDADVWRKFFPEDYEDESEE